MKKVLSLIFVFCLFSSIAKAQTAEVTIQLNEQFFDVLLDALFQNGGSPEFPISSLQEEEKMRKREREISFADANYENQKPKTKNQNPICNETIKLLRETGGVKTSVNLRDGRIFAPIAFTGNYNPPLIGCIEFSGVAETNIVLEFDRQKQALIGRAQVTNVTLNGTGGIGGNVLARLVQSSIDQKINPIDIIKLDKVSFVVPIQNAGNLKMKAVGIRHEIGNGVLIVRVAYQFLKQ
ncbi:MAG: hypothetical protein ACR2F2_01915 [Pyrinomonadaceae bacterium]